MPIDIVEYEPRVKCMHIVNFGIGAALQYEVESRMSNEVGDQRLLSRMIKASRMHYKRAQASFPANLETKKRLDNITHVTSTEKYQPQLQDAVSQKGALVPGGIEGYLLKRGPGLFGKWQKRYFVIQDTGDILYFENVCVVFPFCDIDGTNSHCPFRILITAWGRPQRVQLVPRT